jgi:hypothetical protein
LKDFILVGLAIDAKKLHPLARRSGETANQSRKSKNYETKPISDKIKLIIRIRAIFGGTRASGGGAQGPCEQSDPGEGGV